MSAAMTIGRPPRAAHLMDMILHESGDQPNRHGGAEIVSISPEPLHRIDCGGRWAEEHLAATLSRWIDAPPVQVDVWGHRIFFRYVRPYFWMAGEQASFRG